MGSGTGESSGEALGSEGGRSDYREGLETGTTGGEQGVGRTALSGAPSGPCSYLLSVSEVALNFFWAA
jgi:hypothetical protein